MEELVFTEQTFTVQLRYNTMLRSVRTFCQTIILGTLVGITPSITQIMPSIAFAQSPDYFSSDPAVLLETGQSLLQNGSFTNAEIVFTQLFTSIRVSQGLYHESQIAALDRLIAVSIAQADWDQFNRHLAYYEWLTERLYHDQSTLQAEHLQNVARWHQIGAMGSVDERRTWHLIRARNLTWQAVTALESESAGDKRLAPLLYSIALYHYYLVNEASRRGLTSMEVRTDNPVLLSGWALNGGEAGRRSYAVGSELIERILRIYQQTPDIDNQTLAIVETYAGDWHQMFGREQRAVAHYQRAKQLLMQSANTELIVRLFDSGITLPVTVFDTNSADQLTLVDDSTGAGLRPRRPMYDVGLLE